MENEPSSRQRATPQPQRRNVGSRIFHCFVIVLFLAVLVLSVVSLGSFAYKHHQINKDTDYNNDANGRCILYSDYNKDEKRLPLHLGIDGPCLYSMCAEGVVALVSAVFIAVLVVKACAGFSAVSFLACTAVDLFCVLVLLLMSLAVGINIAIGIEVTCHEVGKTYQSAKELPHSCNGYKLRGKKDDIAFYDQILQAELTAWIAAAFLCVIFLVYTILLSCYCCKRQQSRPEEKRPLVSRKESETRTPFS